jgi:hypothetical protein
MDRLVLGDGQWARIAPHVIGDERTRHHNLHSIKNKRKSAYLPREGALPLAPQDREHVRETQDWRRM